MSKALPEKPSDRKFVILAYVLGVAHLVFGGTKVLGIQSMTDEFTLVWHFPLWFMYFVGVSQLVCGALLFVRNLRLPASFAMALTMIGGFATAIAATQPVNAVVTLVVAALCLLVAKHRFFQLVEELSVEAK